MRLGKQTSVMKLSQVLNLYSEAERVESKKYISERFRHRYEVHPEFARKLEGTSLKVV